MVGTRVRRFRRRHGEGKEEGVGGGSDSRLRVKGLGDGVVLGLGMGFCVCLLLRYMDLMWIGYDDMTLYCLARNLIFKYVHGDILLTILDLAPVHECWSYR